MPDKLTVIVTTYNHAAYVRQALESVFMQQTRDPFDVVVIDDASTDRTREILLAEQARRGARLRLVLPPINRCDNVIFGEEYDAVTSQYVAWLDGDDYWTSPFELQRQVDFLDANPDYTTCFHNVDVFQDDQPTFSRTEHPPGVPPQVTLPALWESTPIPACSPMFRKGALPQVPAWYGQVRWGDLPMYMLFAERGKIGYIDDVLGAYRRHASGMWSGQNVIEQLEAMVDFLGELNDVFDGKYDELARRMIFKRSNELAIERVLADERRALVHAYAGCLATGATYAGFVRDRVERFVSESLPVDAAVAVLAEDEAHPLRLDSRRRWTLSRVRTASEVLVGEGPTGVRPVEFGGTDVETVFRLYDGRHRRRLLLADVAGTGEREAQPAQSRSTASPAGVVLSLFPSTGPNDPPGEVRWESPGRWVQVTGAAVTAVDGEISSPHLIGSLHTALHEGAEYLLISAAQVQWLARLQGLKRHLERRFPLAAARRGTAAVFDLRRQEELDCIVDTARPRSWHSAGST